MIRVAPTEVTAIKHMLDSTNEGGNVSDSAGMVEALLTLVLFQGEVFAGPQGSA